MSHPSLILKKVESENLLEELLEKFSCAPIIVKNDLSNIEVLLEINKQKVLEEVALTVWNDFLKDKKNYYNDFMQGLEHVIVNNSQVDLSSYEDVLIFDLFSNALYPEIKKKELSSKDFLKSFNSNESFNAIVSDRLYSQTLQEGSGQAIEASTPTIFAYYEVKDFDGNEIEVTSTFDNAKEIQLSESIPGFAHGVQGMKVGEIRKLIIHPCFAYGFENVYGTGKPLIVTIKLMGANFDHKGVEASLPCLIPFDLVQTTVEHSIKSYEDYEKAEKKYASYNGVCVGNFYLKANKYFSLEDLKAELENCQIKKDALHVYDEELLHTFHLYLYNEEEGLKS